MQHLIILGNPVTGYRYIGPFGTNHDAQNWGADNLDGLHWWTVAVEVPATFKR